MRNELHHFYSDLMQQAIDKTLSQNKKLAIIINKKSYAKWILCLDCGHIPECNNCNVAIAYHQPNEHNNFTMCHICKSSYKTPQKCSQCWSQKIQPYGIGIEQVSQRIQQQYNQTPLIINSQSSNSLSKSKHILGKINDHHIIIASSLICLGLKQPQLWDKVFDCIIFLNVDAWLNIPDFASPNNTFYMIYDTIISHHCVNFILQTHKPDHPAIRLACSLQLQERKKHDKLFRQQHHYPPYGDICILMYKNEIEKKVFNTVNKLYQELLYLKENQKSLSSNWLEKNNTEDIKQKTSGSSERSEHSLFSLEIYASPPLIYKMFSKYRYHIIIKGHNIRPFIQQAYTQLNIATRWFKVNRQATELL